LLSELNHLFCSLIISLLWQNLSESLSPVSESHEPFLASYFVLQTQQSLFQTLFLKQSTLYLYSLPLHQEE